MEDNFQDFFKETGKLAKDYAEKRIDLLKMQTTLKTVKALSLFFTLLMAFFVLLFALIFFGMSFSYWLAEKTGSIATGFAVCAGAFTLLFVLLLVFRKQLLMGPMANIMVREMETGDDDL